MPSTDWPKSEWGVGGGPGPAGEVRVLTSLSHFCYDSIYYLLTILTGLHVEERYSVSVKDFYCWISIISSEGDSLRFDLRPVESQADHQLLTYHMRSTGDVLSRISRESLLPGDYDAFAPGMNRVLVYQRVVVSQGIHIFLRLPARTIQLLQLGISWHGSYVVLFARWGMAINQPSKKIHKGVFAVSINTLLNAPHSHSSMTDSAHPCVEGVRQISRDYQQCVMTGTSSNDAQLTVTWIYLPCLASDVCPICRST